MSETTLADGLRELRDIWNHPASVYHRLKQHLEAVSNWQPMWWGNTVDGDTARAAEGSGGLPVPLRPDGYAIANIVATTDDTFFGRPFSWCERIEQVEDAGAPIKFVVTLTHDEAHEWAERRGIVAMIGDRTPWVSRQIVKDFGPASWLSEVVESVTAESEGNSDWSRDGRSYRWTFTTGRIDSRRPDGTYDGGDGRVWGESDDYLVWQSHDPGFEWNGPRDHTGQFVVEDGHDELTRRQQRDRTMHVRPNPAPLTEAQHVELIHRPKPAHMTADEFEAYRMRRLELVTRYTRKTLHVGRAFLLAD